jgi:hypothetical protein
MVENDHFTVAAALLVSMSRSSCVNTDPFDSRGTIQSCLFSRINPNKRLGFLNTWFSSPILLGFLLSSQPYSQSFIRNPNVFRIFLFNFLSGFINPSKFFWFSWNCFNLI